MKNIILIGIALLAISCGSSKKQDPAPAPAAAPQPTAVALISPASNEACITGTMVSGTESRVSFSWTAVANADSYMLTVTNLLTKVQQTQATVSNSATAVLLNNTPYSWQVTSKSGSSTATATSPTWKFYSSGPGVSSHPPYPAEITSPTIGQTLTPTNGKIVLQWKGSDADNDIANYDVYLGTTNNPLLVNGQHTSTTLTDVGVIANTTYYWKVITRDTKGNTSDSGVYEFKTN